MYRQASIIGLVLTALIVTNRRHHRLGRTVRLDQPQPPQNSAALTAHLSEASAGRGLATVLDDAASLLFSSTEDPDYQAMLQAIHQGRKH
jgi:hypothetical protein